MSDSKQWVGGWDEDEDVEMDVKDEEWYAKKGE